MSILFKFFLIFIILTTQGCQLIPSYQSFKQKTTKAELDQDQINRLFRQGNRYNKLSKEEKKVVCKHLNQDYQKVADWQTAWLLVYSLNDDFNCVNLKDTLILLKVIQANKNLNTPLQWLNANQIKVLNKLNRLQTKNNKFQRKNNSLKGKLNEAEIQLQDVIAKIQALKVIETTINQKTQ